MSSIIAEIRTARLLGDSHVDLYNASDLREALQASHTAGEILVSNQNASREPVSETKIAAVETATTLAPPALLYQLATGHFLSRALFVVVQLGIADLLKDGPRHFHELAELTGTHPRSLNRVMRLLASAGVFEEKEDGNFALTPVGECLRDGVPGSSRSMVMHFAGNRIHESWRDLEYCVKTGEPAYRRRGVANPYADPLRTPEDYAIFDAAMADLSRLVVAAVVSSYDFTPFTSVIDVGGGNGELVIGILRMNGELQGVVFEQPAAAERASARIGQEGLAARCRAIGGDFFKEVPPGGSVYILKHVIHNWDDDRAVSILATCRRAMTRQSKLLIIEGVYPSRIDQSPESRRAAAGDVHMLVSTGGRRRSEVEFRSLFESAGLELTKIIPTKAMVSIIEGIRV